jgi:menaquinol-cytochrome c reductase cytochrome b/c subunit
MANGTHHDIEYVGDSRVSAVRKPNIPRDYADFPGKTEAFFPDFLLKEWMVGAVALVGIMVLVISSPPEIGTVANPTDTSFIPVPDWYFLFLYQFLKYPFAQQQFVVMGTVVIPGIAFLALVLAPWLDRSPHRRPSKRPIATGLMLLAICSIFYLTWEGQMQYIAELKATGQWPPPEEKVAKAPPKGGEAGGALDGASIWASQTNCQGCHGVNMEGQSGGAPGLQHVGSTRTYDEILDIIQNGVPNGKPFPMPAGQFQGTPDEMKALAKWLSEQK